MCIGRKLHTVGIVIVIGTAVSSCAHQGTAAAPTASQEMHHILTAFDQVGAVRFPLVRQGSVLPPEMEKPVSWYWQGPVDQAVRIVADRVGYAVDIPPDPDPPVISISEENTTMAGLLDEMAAAATDQAEIDIDVQSHTIRVKWNG